MSGRARQLLPQGRSVLVTGASTGLGRACALTLERAGFRVFAGVRREADGKELADAAAYGRLRPVHLDVTDGADIEAAAAEVSETVGERGLWGLVNNAGICVAAPLECVTAEQLRTQLDTNVVGQLTVTRAVLPALRRAGGRVVNVTSGLGSVAMPYLGAYSMAQFAKEAMSDVLRRELRPQGVTVSVVQPGAVMTPIWGKVSDLGRAALGAAPAEIAELYRDRFLRFLRQNEQQAAHSPTRPEDFARAVTHALTTLRPRSRHPVGADARRMAVLARLLPDPALDHRLRALTG